jgi:hypothetical protein
MAATGGLAEGVERRFRRPAAPPHPPDLVPPQRRGGTAPFTNGKSRFRVRYYPGAAGFAYTLQSSGFEA